MALNKKRKVAILIGSCVAIIAIVLYYRALSWVSTDNARVKMANVWVSPEVSGYIVKVNFKDGDYVKKNDVIVQLDIEKYEIALKQAEADYRYAKNEYDRYVKLKKDGFVSDSDADLIKNRFDLATQGLKLAKYNFDKTNIIAQNDGILANFDAVKLGDFVPVGAMIFNIVSKSDTWIEANFKEVDIKDVKIGQEAIVEIDTFGGKKYKAKVVNISSATGSEFSLLPAQNSSGNWIKVIQRVSVKLEFEKDEDISKFASGMSAYVTIKVRD